MILYHSFLIRYVKLNDYNTFRDGISYNEQQQEKPLVKLDDFASLGVGECYTLLPIPEVRLSKMQVPESKRKDKNPGFVEAIELEIIESSNPSLLDQDDDEYAGSDNLPTDYQNNDKGNNLLLGIDKTIDLIRERQKIKKYAVKYLSLGNNNTEIDEKEL